MEVINELTKLGNVIEPVIEEYLRKNADEKFVEAILYQIRTGGKRIRPALTLLSAAAAGGSFEDALPAAAAVELAHNYSLIIDDIIDHSELRRGKPTVWKKYGISIALLVAIHYRESISEALNDTKDPPLFNEIMARTIKFITEGERLDILFEQAGREDEPYVIMNRYKEITLDMYIDMVYKKTGCLIETSCLLGALSANKDKKIYHALSNYGRALGIAFQIGDDIIDLFGSERKTGKVVGGDIIEHKLGNVVITLALKELNGKYKDKLLRILRTKNVGKENVKEVIRIISSYTKAREEAEKLRKRYVNEAIKSLEKIPDSKYKTLLIELARFIETRDY